MTLELSVKEKMVEKLSASLDAITSQGTLREFIKEREATNRPSNSVHHEAWGASASLCLGPDGKLNPSFMPSYERDGVRTSATLSLDLLRGFNLLANALSNDYASRKQDYEHKLASTSKKLIEGKSDKLKPELKKKLLEDAEKLSEGDGATRNEYYKLSAKAKDALGIKEEGFFSKLGAFMGNLFSSKNDESLKPFESLTPEDQLQLANLMGWIYGMSQMVSMQDSPGAVRKSLEDITAKLHTLETQYLAEAVKDGFILQDKDLTDEEKRVVAGLRRKYAKYLEEGDSKEEASRKAFEDQDREEAAIKKFRDGGLKGPAIVQQKSLDKSKPAKEEKLSFERFKELKQKEIKTIKSSSESYSMERGVYSYLDVITEQPLVSEAELKREYQNYVNNYLYLQDQKQIIMSDVRTQLQESEQRDYGWQVLKHVDQIYIVWKGAARGTVLMAEDLLNEISPATHTEVRNKLTKFGKVVGSGVQKADGTLENLFGQSYSSFKGHAGEFVTEFNKNAPEIVQDITLLLAGEGIVGGALKGAGSIIKAGKATGKLASTTAAAGIKELGDVISDAANNVRRLTQPMSFATPEGGISMGPGFADDFLQVMSKKSDNLFSVVDDIRVKVNPLQTAAKKIDEGAAFKLAEYKFTNIEAYLEKVELSTFEKVIANPEIKPLMKKWGISKSGNNQLLEHTFGKFQEPKRLLRLEEYSGLKPGSLSDIYSNNPQKVIDSLKNFDDLAQRIRTNPTESVILDGGRKEVYWMRSTHNYNKGIGYIEYDGKPQSLMNMDKDYFNNELKSRL